MNKKELQELVFRGAVFTTNAGAAHHTMDYPEIAKGLITSIGANGYERLQYGSGDYADAVVRLDLYPNTTAPIYKSGVYTFSPDWPNNLPVASSIHSLSEMGEALTGQDDYPFDWVDEVCELNNWLSLEDIGRHDEDICTNGRDILFWTCDRNNAFVADTRECREEDFAAWEKNIVNSYPEYSDELARIRKYRLRIFK